MTQSIQERFTTLSTLRRGPAEKGLAAVGASPLPAREGPARRLVWALDPFVSGPMCVAPPSIVGELIELRWCHDVVALGVVAATSPQSATDPLLTGTSRMRACGVRKTCGGSLLWLLLSACFCITVSFLPDFDIDFLRDHQQK